MFTIAIQEDEEWKLTRVEDEQMMQNGKIGSFKKHDCFYIFISDDSEYMAVALCSNGKFENMTNTSLYLFNSIYS
jgi:hypothetical protein